MNDKVFTDQLIDHADRFWQAECANSDRAVSKSNKITTGLVALFGLGLFQIEWYRSPTDVPTMMPSAGLAVTMLLIFAVLCFVISIVVLRGIRVRWKKRTNIEPFLESMRLTLPIKTLLEDPNSNSSEAVSRAVFLRTYSAALNLQKRNNRKFRRIAHAMIPCGMGLASVVIAMLIYMISMSSGYTVPSGTENPNARYKQGQEQEQEHGSGVEPSTARDAGT